MVAGREDGGGRGIMKSSTVNMVVQKKHHILYGWGHLNSLLSRQKSSTPPLSPRSGVKKNYRSPTISVTVNVTVSQL